MTRTPILWYILTASCDEAARLTSLSMERELQPAEWWALRGHTAVCGGCRRFAANLAIMRETLRRAAAASEDAETTDRVPALSDDARERIRRSLRDSLHDDDARGA